MLFNTPIPRAVQPKFHEGSALRPTRDADTNAQAWKKNSTVSKQSSGLESAVSKLRQDMTRLRRRQPGYQSSQVYGLAFKIYNAPNPVDGTLSWRTFQVNGGFYGCRPINNDLTVGTGAVPLHSVYDYGNEEIRMYNTGAAPAAGGYNLDGPLRAWNPSSGSGLQVVLPDLGDTDLTLPGLTLAGHETAQVILADGFDSEFECNASFWLQLIDEPPAFGTYHIYLGLFARMWSSVGGFGRSAQIFPDPDPNIIPLGTITILGSVSKTIDICQLLEGNQLNRYPTYIRTYRGKWVENSLSGQVFYNGDEVIDDVALLAQPIIGGGTLGYYGIYKWIGGIGTGTLRPGLDPLSWEKVAMTV